MHTFLFKVQGLHFLKEYKGIWEMWREREAFFNSFFWRPGRFFTAWMREGSLSWLSASRTQTPSIPLSLSLSPVWRCMSDSPRGLWDMYGVSCLEQRSSLVSQRHSLTCDTRWQTSTLRTPRERERDREVNDGEKRGVPSHRLDRG